MIRFKIKYWDEDANDAIAEHGIAAIKTSIGATIDEIYQYYGAENVYELSFYELESSIVPDELHAFLRENE